MNNKKFCIVGVDNDFIDFIKENYSMFVGYFSKKKKHYDLINKKNWLGEHNGVNWRKIKKKFNPKIIINIDEGKEREKLFKKIYKNSLGNIFMKNSYISKNTKSNLIKKKGIIVQSHVKIMPYVKIQHGVKINIGAQLHHNCKVGKFVTIAPRAVLLGNVKIGNYSYIGANATIKQNIVIGKESIVGAGAVVTRNVKDYDIVVGSPAKSIKKTKKKRF